MKAERDGRRADETLTLAGRSKRQRLGKHASLPKTEGESDQKAENMKQVPTCSFQSLRVEGWGSQCAGLQPHPAKCASFSFRVGGSGGLLFLDDGNLACFPLLLSLLLASPPFAAFLGCRMAH